MIADQVSSTALTVIQGILYTARNPHLKQLLSGDQIDAYKLVLNASEPGRKRLKLLESPLFRAIVPILERLLMPGITLHYVLRKRFIEEAVLASVTAGVTQVVVVGAGFDMLSWRLHKTFPETTFIEIDHPATSTIKGRAIGKTADNYHVVAVDLGEDDIETVLTDFTPFDSQQQTLYVCEGVLMYLDEVAVRKLFASINNLTGVGSRFVFSVAAPMMSTESNTTFLLDLYLRFKGEPLKWGLEQKHLEEFVSAQGYKLNKIADDVGLLAQYLTSPFSGPIHAGEYLALTVIE